MYFGPILVKNKLLNCCGATPKKVLVLVGACHKFGWMGSRAGPQILVKNYHFLFLLTSDIDASKTCRNIKNIFPYQGILKNPQPIKKCQFGLWGGSTLSCSPPKNTILTSPLEKGEFVFHYQVVFSALICQNDLSVDFALDFPI